MRRGRRLVSVMLALTMVLSMYGCGKKQEPKVTEETTTEATEGTQEDTEEKEDAVPYGQGNMIRNGDFEDGTGSFTTYTNGGQAEMEVNDTGELQLDIAKIGQVEHGVQVYYDGFAIRQGGVYEFSFDVRGTLERDVDWRIQVNGGDYHAYIVDTVKVTEEVQHVSGKFTMEEETDPAPRLCFNMGYVNSMKEAGVEADSIGEHSIMIDNVSLVVVDGTNMIKDPEPVYVPKTKINQLGYKKEDKKVAIFSDLEKDDTTFKVVNTDTDEIVFEGTLTERDLNIIADEWNNIGDFSAVKEAGTYKVVSGKGEESFPFTIGDNVYDEAFNSVVKMLYLQRCGIELTSEYAGDYSHPVCHNTQATVYGTNKKLDVSGGWHDAGDYGRYVVSGAKTVADVLLAYEKNPEAFSDNMGIPESSNGVSDALDEVKYELDWMLKMQDSSNGGVYHKVTCAVFPETVMPQDETDELIIAPISNTATGDFAAVMAMAGRIFKRDGKGDYAAYGDTCLEAAKKAWTYLEAHKEDKGFKNPEEIVTGEYPDGNCADESFWAAAELYKATEDVSYKEAMTSLIEEKDVLKGFGWMKVGYYGAYAVLTTDSLKEDSGNLYHQVKEAFFTAVDEAMERSKENNYQVDRERTYEWGSNMAIANSGMLLSMANDIDPKAEYLNYAKSHLHYLMGVNATGYCFITGSGSLCPENPHHRPSQVLEKCMPGMLVGGPNSNLEDPYAKAVFLNTAAAKCYADSVQSYSCNEVTIYWNSPLIYLMTATN